MRRRFLTIAIFLLAGAVMNVAVAWGCALRKTVSPANLLLALEQMPTLFRDAERSWAENPAAPSEARLLTVDEAQATAVALRLMVGSATVRFEFEASGNSGAWTLPTLPGSQSNSLDRVLEIWAGWPLLALHGEQWNMKWPTNKPWQDIFWLRNLGTYPMNVGRSEARWAHVLGSDVLSGQPGRFLPLRPVWPGFAINTLFYAAILWLLIPGPFVLRRLIRQRRGLCPKCAYPMGESAVCTECGRELPQRVRAMT